MSCPLPVFVGDVLLTEDTTFTVTVEDPADGVTFVDLPSSFVGSPPYYSGFWDFTVASAVTVNAIQFKPTSSTTATWDIYMRSGTAAGHESSATGWTLIESASITTVGNVVYSIPLTSPLALSAGTYGFYLRKSAGSGFLRYLTGINPTSDSYITITPICCSGSGLFAGSSGAVSIEIGVEYQYGTPIPRTNTLDVAAGSWFATPLNALAYALEQFNLDGDYSLGTLAFSIETDAGANQGKVTVTGFAGTLLIDLGADLNDRLALPSVATAPPYTTGAMAGVFWATFQVSEYTRSSELIDGGSTRGFNGSVFSVRGLVQPKRDISVLLDMRAGRTEWLGWVAMWEDYWRLGKSVAFYLDSTQLPTSGSDIGDGESLVVEDADALNPKRLDEYQNLITEDGPHTFFLRRSTPVGYRVGMELR